MKKSKQKFTIGEHILIFGFVVVYVTIVTGFDVASNVRGLFSKGSHK